MNTKNPYKVEWKSLNRFRGVETPELAGVLTPEYVGHSLNAVSPKMGELRHRCGQNFKGVVLKGQGLLNGVAFQDNALVVGVGDSVFAEEEDVDTMLPFWG